LRKSPMAKTKICDPVSDKGDDEKRVGGLVWLKEKAKGRGKPLGYVTCRERSNSRPASVKDEERHVPRASRWGHLSSTL